MPQRLVLTVLAAALCLGGACYQDDTTFPPTLPVARVLLTDAPFPHDSVASVNVYVVRVEAKAHVGPAAGEWAVVAEPRRVFNLLQLRRGTTAFLGERELQAGQYHMIRMTIDTSESSIVWKDGSRARVNWENGSGSNEQAVYAVVQYPMNVALSGAEIVIDFDVGRSFLYDFYGARDFTFVPQLRAVDAATTGTIGGTVASDYTGTIATVPNATVSVYVGDPGQARETWSLVATARTDSGGTFAGYYRIAFLPAGTYIVRAEQPANPLVGSALAQNVQVVAGEDQVTTPVLFLPKANPDGGPFIRIWPRDNTNMGVGGRQYLRAAVGDANGDPVPNPSVTWTSSDTAVASVTGTGDTAVVTGRVAGLTTITAASGGLSDTVTVQVFGSPTEPPGGGPVATVAIEPDNATLAVGDTAAFYAFARDSLGHEVTREVSWFGTDSLVFVIEGLASRYALIRARGAGTAVLRATIEGKVGQATVTVH